jgi:hypothetical protein
MPKEKKPAPSTTVSPARLSWAMASAILAIFVIASATGLLGSYNFLGAYLGGVVLVIFARLFSKMKLPKLALSSLILSVILVAVILVLAVASNMPTIALATPTSDNALALAVVLLIWVQQAVSILLIIGLIMYVVRIGRARRAAVGE